MWQTTLVALRATVVTLVLTGIVYPVAMTGLAQILFPWQANGSLITGDAGTVVGSALIGQAFRSPHYFWPRPSAAGADGYDATASGGSNLGSTSQKLRDRIGNDLARLKESNPGADGLVPVDLVTASASGLDPHLSPAAARWQVPRVAAARHVSVERVRQVVEAEIEGRELGFFGEERVNVVRLNLALDLRFGRQSAAAR